MFFLSFTVFDSVASPDWPAAFQINFRFYHFFFNFNLIWFFSCLTIWGTDIPLLVLQTNLEIRLRVQISNGCNDINHKFFGIISRIMLYRCLHCDYCLKSDKYLLMHLLVILFIKYKKGFSSAVMFCFKFSSDGALMSTGLVVWGVRGCPYMYGSKINEWCHIWFFSVLNDRHFLFLRWNCKNLLGLMRGP